MSAWFLTDFNRAAVVSDVWAAPTGSRVTVDGPKRTNPQNRMMWRLLNCFADQVEHYGRKYDAEVWKSILLKAFGKELSFVPSLDGQSVVALGYRSSLLLTEEMAAFIEFIFSEGARLAVDFDGDLPEPAKAHEPAR